MNQTLPDGISSAELNLLHAFTTRHQSHHRPIALVTSGGTAADLEMQTVRFIDNFSTGKRGAISVEEFLKRGYACIHLMREGCASPYSRVLSEILGVRQGNHGLGFDALGHLFDGQNLENETEEEANKQAYCNDDPFLSSPPRKAAGVKSLKSDDYTSSRMNLKRNVLNSTILQMKLRERADVVNSGLLLTLKFRTVEEYLAKLKICSEAINDCQSLGLIFLTAAVSDFYIPKNQMTEHKIQSQEYGLSKADGINSEAISLDENNCLHIQLSPVPKMIPLIRKEYAPNAFCVSFKLETDRSILLEKSKLAIKKYDVHMVIGNVLSTRYEKVWISQNHSSVANNAANENDLVETIELSKSSADIELEETLVTHVIERHFEYISNHYIVSNYNSNPGSDGVFPETALMAGAEAVAKQNEYIQEKKRQLQREFYRKRIRDMSLQVAGHAIGMYLTYIASSAFQRRMRL